MFKVLQNIHEIAKPIVRIFFVNHPHTTRFNIASPSMRRRPLIRQLYMPLWVLSGSLSARHPEVLLRAPSKCPDTRGFSASDTRAASGRRLRRYARGKTRRRTCLGLSLFFHWFVLAVRHEYAYGTFWTIFVAAHCTIFNIIF